LFFINTQPRLLPVPAEVAGKQLEHSRTMSHLDQLHNAYQECLGLRLISEEGEQQQQQHASSSSSNMHAAAATCKAS
jgi:hypothetical protein